MSLCLDTTLHVLRAHLRRPTIAPELELERDLGVDPFDLVLLVAELEEALHVRVRYEDLATLRTVADVAGLLQDGAPASLRPARTGSGCLPRGIAPRRDTA